MRTYISLDNYEVEVIVNYNIYGKDKVATWNNPPEYAELEIEDITYNIYDEDGNNVTISPELLETINTMIDKDRIEELCWDDAKQESDDY
jgi:hypothetical protein